MEQRRHPRKPCAITVDAATRAGTRLERLRDISIGGALIETGHHFRLGEEIMLTIPTSRPGKTVVIKALVVRKSEKGVGVEFIRNSRETL